METGDRRTFIRLHARLAPHRQMGHDIWVKTFQEPGLVDWLFAQHR